jgi:hypothetical protein
MTVAERPAAISRSTPTVRRIGYALAVVVNLGILLLTVVWPGWEAVPFLTPATAEVIPLFVASLSVGMAVNVINLIVDSRVVWSLGEIVGAIFAFAVALSLWQVFPFDFSSSLVDWTLFVRFFLGVVMFGCAVGVISHVVMLIRMAVVATRR